MLEQKRRIRIMGETCGYKNKNTHFKPEKKNDGEIWNPGFPKHQSFKQIGCILYIEVSVDGCLMAWMLL